MKIVKRELSSDHIHPNVFADWKVLVVDENWKQRQRLAKLLTPFFKKVELIFDVKDAIASLVKGDDMAELVIFGVHFTSKEAVAWIKSLKEFESRPKVLLCADTVEEELESTANAIAADGCVAVGGDDGQVMGELAAAVGEEFSMSDFVEQSEPSGELAEPESVADAATESEPEIEEIVSEEMVAEEQSDFSLATELTIKDVIEIPEPTDIVLELRELFQRQKRTRAEEIEAIVDSDYKLKNRVLKSIAASFFGVKVKTKISSISHAINLVGMKPVVNFVNLISLNTASAKRTGKITDFAYKYWKYALASGIACVDLHPHIAEKRFDFDSSDAFLLGAIHNLGIVLISREFPDEYPHMMSEFWRKHHSGEGQNELEKEEYGFDHAQVSALIAKEWQMPEDLQHAVASHHDLAFKSNNKKQIALHNMLMLSDYMTNHYLFNNFDYTLLNKDVGPAAKAFGEDLESLKKMKETIRSQLMANINLIG